MVPGQKNVIRESLIPTDLVLIPPLPIKLGGIKQFVKALKVRESDAFKYLFIKFPKLSEAKIKEGVFNGPQIRSLLPDKVFESKMSSEEKAAWQIFKDLATKCVKVAHKRKSIRRSFDTKKTRYSHKKD